MSTNPARYVTDGLVGDDRAAVTWAVFAVQSPAGRLVTERMSRYEHPAVTDELLVEVRSEWEAAGRPVVRPHAHCDEVTFADGTTIVGARFLVDDPYRRDRPPTFGLYLDERWAPPGRWEEALERGSEVLFVGASSAWIHRFASVRVPSWGDLAGGRRCGRWCVAGAR